MSSTTAGRWPETIRPTRVRRCRPDRLPRRERLAPSEKRVQVRPWLSFLFSISPSESVKYGGISRVSVAGLGATLGDVSGAKRAFFASFSGAERAFSMSFSSSLDSVLKLFRKIGLFVDMPRSLSPRREILRTIHIPCVNTALSR
jgi:hypothetical protein